jgi:hypothetical protein
MKYFMITLVLCCTSTLSFASNEQCLSNKYDSYIDASLTWYQDLIKLTTAKNPDLADVGDWFYQGREHHFELNRAIAHQYLIEARDKVATEQPLESWLDIKQSDIKKLASRDDQLGQIAAVSFQDRQSPPHPKNYQLRSALAELLSHPMEIESALNKYNQAIEQAESISCP